MSLSHGKRERAALRRWAVGLRGAGGRYARGLLSGRAKRADAAWERRAGWGGRRAERASAGCSRGCWRGRKCASARGAGGSDPLRLPGGAAGSDRGGASDAHAALSARGWAAAVGRAGQAARGGKRGVSWARGVGPGRWDGPRLAGLSAGVVWAGFGSSLFFLFLSKF